jgi:nucleoside-diphosphate-sugar epimerase
MKLLMLGGTRFVGRALVDAALEQGAEVTVVSRGESAEPAPGTTWFRADRRDQDALVPLARSEWDAVFDTWDGPASVVADSTALLADSAQWYGYVSSRSAYRWPPAPGSDESAPLVDPDPDGGYPAAKRGAEIAVLTHFDGRSMLARAGLILGPYEDAGRLTWWLQRAAGGGTLVAPEPAEQVWQALDARDLAAFMVGGVMTRTAGAFNVVGPRSNGLTTRRLVEACIEVTGARAELVWVAEALLTRAGVREWDDLPGWIPPESEAAGMHDCDVSAAVAAGLRCRPIEATVADTWAWMQGLPAKARRPLRAGLPRRGLSAEQEQEIWWLAAAPAKHESRMPG